MNEDSPNGDPEDAVTPTVMAEERGAGGGAARTRRAGEQGWPQTAEAIVKGTDSASPEAAPSQAEDAEFFSISDLCCSDRLLTM